MRSRIRSLKPEHKTHRKIGPLSDRGYRLWVGLLTESDDAGRFIADLGQLKATIFAYQPELPEAELEAALRELEGPGLIARYALNGSCYGYFPSWADHQRIDRPTPSQLPKPKTRAGTATSPPRGLASPRESSTRPRESSRRIGSGSDQDRIGSGPGSGSEGIGSASATKAVAPPTPFQIPESIQKALARCPTFGPVALVNGPKFWQAQIRARARVNFADELLKAQAWLVANPTKAPRSNVAAFLQRWFARAAERTEA